MLRELEGVMKKAEESRRSPVRDVAEREGAQPMYVCGLEPRLRDLCDEELRVRLLK